MPSFWRTYTGYFHTPQGVVNEAVTEKFLVRFAFGGMVLLLGFQHLVYKSNELIMLR